MTSPNDHIVKNILQMGSIFFSPEWVKNIACVGQNTDKFEQKEVLLKTVKKNMGSLVLIGPPWPRKTVLDSMYWRVDGFLQPKRRDYALLVNYYGKRGDKHSARAVFESMRAAGIDPNVHAYTK